MKERHLKIIATVSGGLDSITMLYHLKSIGYEVFALGVDYGQRHRKELEYAQQACDRLGVEFRRADLTSLQPILKGSSQTDPAIAVPEGHYAEETMKLTIVPNRNMILLSIAGAWAVAEKAYAIAYAAHRGDHAIYPDCRPEFMRAMDAALQLCDWHQVTLYAPFGVMTKAEIVGLGASLKVPFDETWSCYNGVGFHCGRCSTCYERREAFVVAGVRDPTMYRDGTPFEDLKAEFDKRLENQGPREAIPAEPRGEVIQPSADQAFADRFIPTDAPVRHGERVQTMEQWEASLDDEPHP